MNPHADTRASRPEMATSAGVVLAGGQSTRMGRAKAELEWHGSTLLHRVCGLIARVVDGPVVVVRAPGQELPSLPRGVEVSEDAREGRGPLEGLAAGLRALDGRARAAYVSSTDVPLLHPAFVELVLAAVAREDVDVALPVAQGFRQPLAAAYRTELLADVEELIGADRTRPAFLFERCRVRELSEQEMLADPALAQADPTLLSLLNLNEPQEYERARALSAPAVSVRCSGAPFAAGAATLGEAAQAAGVALDHHLVAKLNGDRVAPDAELPLAAGDSVAFRAAGTEG